MGYVVRMPKLGLEMERGTVLEWHIGEGDTVEKGNVLVEVESEKSIGEVEARENGALRLVAIDTEETVPPGTPIGIVADPEEDITDLEAEFGSGDAEDAAEADETADTENDEGDGSAGAVGAADPTAESDDIAGEASSGPEATDVKASPRAKRRADELVIDLAGVEGSGPQGAITADDVDAAAEGETTGTVSSEAAPSANETELRPQAEELLYGLSAAGVPPLYRLSVPEARGGRHRRGGGRRARRDRRGR